jgi:hypothetical protein
LLLLTFWPTFLVGQRTKKGPSFEIICLSGASRHIQQKNPKKVFQFVAMISRKWAYSLDIWGVAN